MKKLIPVLLVFLSFLPARAQADDIATCLNAVLPTFKMLAEHKGAKLLEETIYVRGIDDRWNNPYKYVWFAASAEQPDGTLIKLTNMMQVGSRIAKACKKLLREPGEDSSQQAAFE